MTEEQLVGFIGDVHGNEGNLTAFDAVSRKVDSLLRYPAAGGAPVTIQESDLEFVQPVPDEVAALWRPGHVVWFAGRTFVVRGSANSAVKALLAGWVLTDRGHRVFTGTPRQLRGMRDKASESLSVILAEYLCDPLEKRHEQAAMVFDLFLAVESGPTRRRFLMSAFFYEETRQLELFGFTRERAARSGAFESFDAFDQEFEQHHAWLRRRRISELERQDAPREALSADMEARVFLAISRAYMLESRNPYADPLRALLKKAAQEPSGMTLHLHETAARVRQAIEGEVSRWSTKI